MPRPLRKAEHGAATLAIVTLLLLVMTLTAAYLQRGLVFEQKTSMHQYRATQATESAEAGLEWGLSMLNAAHVDEACRPRPEGRTLREHLLVPADAQGASFMVDFDPSRAVAPACAHGPDGWACRCPDLGTPSPPVPSDDELHPGFRVAFNGSAGPHGEPMRGVVRLVAHGCAHAGPPFCADAPSTDPGHAVLSVQVALVPALAAIPPAALTAVGDVDFGSDAVGVQNGDRSTGWLLQSGGTVTVTNARLSPPAGTPAAAALDDHDAVLAARSTDALARLHLGMPLPAYARLPGVVSLACPAGDCKPALQAALAAGNRMLRVAGDLVLDEADVGSPGEPVALVVEGALRLGPGARIAGFVLSRSLQWQGGNAGSAWLRGAAVVAGPVVVSGTPDFIRDAAALEHLHAVTGTFARVPGTWKDTP
jgi:hypothetical protein